MTFGEAPSRCPYCGSWKIHRAASVATEAPQRSIELLRQTVSTLADFIWNGRLKTGQHLWSIPVDKMRDWDCILTDAIDELERLRAASVATEAPQRQGTDLAELWRQKVYPHIEREVFMTHLADTTAVGWDDVRSEVSALREIAAPEAPQQQDTKDDLSRVDGVPEGEHGDLPQPATGDESTR